MKCIRDSDMKKNKQTLLDTIYIIFLKTVTDDLY